MSNYAWVCFDCRLTVRRPGLASDVRCRGCARPCTCLGSKVPIPPRAKVKAWEAMFERFYRVRREYLLKTRQSRVQSIHVLEREILRLEAMPANRGRAGRIEHLKKRLSALRLHSL